MSKLNEYFKSLKTSFDTKWGAFVSEGKKCYKEFKNPKTRYKQIPNALTASRLFAPLFIIPAALTGNLFLTGLFALGFAATDGLDGYFARKYKTTSEFGRELDALTDKIFAITLIFPLLFNNPLIISNLIMEFVIGGVNVMSRLNNNMPKTAIIGKVKTGALSLTLIINYIALALGISPAILNFFTGSTLLLQIGTTLKYLSNYRKDEIKKKEESKVETKVENTELIVTDNEKQKIIEPKETEHLVNRETQIEELKKLRESMTPVVQKDEEEKIKKLG